MPKATVLIPTHNHGGTLWYAAQSALNQTVHDIEVIIVGDGPTPATRETALELVRQDTRVQFVEFPKGERHGEANRHQIVQKAGAETVCYLSDDDLWLPEHVETMLTLTAEAEFVSAMHVQVNPDGTLSGWTVDLALPGDREPFFEGNNRIPLSCGAHTMALYRRLPYGWRTTPVGTPTDLYMWQQILSLSDCRAASATRPTILNFPSGHRQSKTIEERCTELKQWWARIEDPAWRYQFVYEVLDMVVRDRAEKWCRLRGDIKHLQGEIKHLQRRHDALEDHFRGLLNTPWWRLRGVLLGLPGVGSLLKRVGRAVWRQ